MAAEAAGSGAWSHGIGLVLIRSLPYTLACTAKSASGMAGGFVGRQPVTLCGLCPSQTAIMKITKGTNSNTTAAMRHLKTIDKVSFYSIDEFISFQLPGRPHSPLGRCYTLSASLVGLAGRRVGSAGFPVPFAWSIAHVV